MLTAFCIAFATAVVVAIWRLPDDEDEDHWDGDHP